MINALETIFKENANNQRAIKMQAYMKNKFTMFGINAPLRKEIIKPFLIKEYLPSLAERDDIIKILWQKPEREFQYFAQILVSKYSKKFIKNDIILFEYMICHKSWWDTIDFIAVHLIGQYFITFPDQINPITDRWMASNNIWLQRCCLLFQLKYKMALDQALLHKFISDLIGSKEFFINKAIGWILREYSKTNPEWVINYVGNTEVSNLSKREALKVILTKAD